jgi:hypothetical protein
MVTDETESHLISVTAPKGTGQRKVLELLRAALEAQGHPVNVRDAALALSANGPADLGAVAAATVRQYLTGQYGDGSGTMTGFDEGRDWQRRQLAARGLK